ncbi:MAG: ferredoxin [Spirochaetes bacterium RIFOXYC1_FULL_54_7]|nr:MAG: ferredoxin [Spirochaetes bacterium RIFOXYC1_FULL_54_7]
MKAKARSVWVRVSIQIFFLLIITLGAVNHTLVERGIQIPLLGSASLHALCPFGGVVTLWHLATAGRLVRQIHESALVLLGLTVVLAVLFGPVFCGWVCPFGSLQEWIGKLGKKLLPKLYNRVVPKKLDYWLRYLRYGVLVWTVYMTATTGVLVFKDYDPYYVLFNFWTGEVAITGFIALAVVLGLSLVMERPFCKYACPMGAVLGLSNISRIFGIKRETSSCIDCEACDRICPMNIEVSTRKRILDHQCISCGECTSDRFCPVAKTVEWKLPAFTGGTSEEGAQS